MKRPAPTEIDPSTVTTDGPFLFHFIRLETAQDQLILWFRQAAAWTAFSQSVTSWADLAISYFYFRTNTILGKVYR